VNVKGTSLVGNGTFQLELPQPGSRARRESNVDESTTVRSDRLDDEVVRSSWMLRQQERQRQRKQKRRVASEDNDNDSSEVAAAAAPPPGDVNLGADLPRFVNNVRGDVEMID